MLKGRSRWGLAFSIVEPMVPIILDRPHDVLSTTSDAGRRQESVLQYPAKFPQLLTPMIIWFTHTRREARHMMFLRLSHLYGCLIAIAHLSLPFARAAFELGYGNDNDLTSFVTRPDIKAPRFDVIVYDPDRVVPGLWFVGPYANIVQEPQPGKYYQACQTGPHIYDQEGKLVWSGACKVANQNTCDFRAWSANGSTFLSAILPRNAQLGDPKGHAMILDNTLQVVDDFEVPLTMPSFNMHEFNVVEDGKTVLYILRRTLVVDIRELDDNEGQAIGYISDLGFAEVVLATGEYIFEWWASDHISLSASSAKVGGLQGPYPEGWNWIHLNSVEKSPSGDYMISARYTDAIYKISGQDGSIIWTLGGKNSSFVLQEGFNFSRQHDARFVEETETTDIISFLDNGGDEHVTTSNFSSALIVKLDRSVTPPYASVIKRYLRPDMGQSKLRGNFQLLPNGNAFVGWSDNCYISEHSPEGDLLMEARFRSTRFVTYRAYKFNFTSAPLDPPVLDAFAYGTSPERSTTVFYVSWNGATEVACWRFYRSTGGGSHPEDNLIGSKERTDFETSFQSDGYERFVYAQAIAKDGSVLGTTDTEAVVLPSEWALPDGRTQLATEQSPLVNADTVAKTEL